VREGGRERESERERGRENTFISFFTRKKIVPKNEKEWVNRTDRRRKIERHTHTHILQTQMVSYLRSKI